MSTLAIQPRRLVLVGSILVDILMYIERLPERGGDRLAQRALMTSGGGYNVLVGAARLGLPVCHAGRVGDGPMGTQIIRDLRAAGISLMLPQVQGEDSGFDIGLVEANGERTFVTSPGTEAQLTLDDLQKIPLQPGDAIYVSGYDLCYPISGAALEAWLPGLSREQLLVIDPGPLVAEIPAPRLARVLARTNILSLNQRELFLLTNLEEISMATQHLLLRLAHESMVVARVGESGCWLACGDQEPLHVPGRAARVVDTTGAGDAHTAALLVRLALGDDLPTAANIANIAASLSVEHAGPATGPTKEALEQEIQVHEMRNEMA